MNQINLTKKAVGNGPLRLSEDGTYITNGHWACRRDLFKQAPLLTTVEALAAMFPRADVDTVDDDAMAMVVPYHHETVTYTRTNWIQTDGKEDAVLFSAKCGSQVWIRRLYADLFNLHEITGESASGGASIDTLMVGAREDWQVIIMPKRLPYQEGLR